MNIRKLAQAVAISFIATTALYGCNSGDQESVKANNYEKTENVVKVFFWYGCPHCYAVHKELRKEHFNNISIEYIAVPGNKTWTYHAANFYAMKRMGLLERMNEKFFDFVQENKSNPSEIQILNFMKANGVNADDYLRMLKSDEVKHDLDNANKLSARYGVQGVPAIYMNGTNEIRLSVLGSYSDVTKKIHEFYAR